MKFKLQGNIERANYFLIYKEFEDHPIFLFSNGEVSDIFNSEENCNYWFNINEINESNNLNFKSKVSGIWTVECFIDCPELKNIDSLNSNKFDYRSLISYLKSSSIINDNYNIEAIDLFNLKEIIIKTKLAIKEEKRNNRINFDKFSILNYNSNNKENKNKYILIRDKNNGYILNDFSGYSKTLTEEKVYFNLNGFKLKEEDKEKLTNIGFNNLSIIFSKFTCFKPDTISLLVREIFNNPISQFDNMDFNELDNIIKNISKNKQNSNFKSIKISNTKEIKISDPKKIKVANSKEIKDSNSNKEPELPRYDLKFEKIDNGKRITAKEKIYNIGTDVIKNKNFHIDYSSYINPEFGEKEISYELRDGKYELLEENIIKNPKKEKKIIGTQKEYFSDTIKDIDLFKNEDLILNKNNNLNISNLIKNTLKSELLKVKINITRNYLDKKKKYETLSYFKLDVTVLNKEQTVNLFYNIVQEDKTNIANFYLYCNNNGVFIEFNKLIDNNEYYNKQYIGHFTKKSLNDYYRDFIQPWKNSDEYKGIKETIEYRTDYKNHYSIDAPDKPVNQRKLVYFYNYLENGTNYNIIKIGRTNNQTNREIQYRRNGFENQGKNPAYLVDYCYIPLTGDEEIDKWVLYCNEDLLKYYCKLLCCESLDAFKSYLSNNGKTKEVNEHIIELLSNNVDLNLLNKMEHRKDESNGKPKLGEEYYEILTDIEDLKYIINNFKNLMNNIKPKDLLKFRSISELKYYIKNKTVVNGEMKLKEEEFIAKVKEILSNE